MGQVPRGTGSTRALRYVGLSEKPEMTLLLRAASSSDFPSENQHSALILTAGRFTSVGEEREAILENVCKYYLVNAKLGL